VFVIDVKIRGGRCRASSTSHVMHDDDDDTLLNTRLLYTTMSTHYPYCAAIAAYHQSTRPREHAAVWANTIKGPSTRVQIRVRFGVRFHAQFAYIRVSGFDYPSDNNYNSFQKKPVEN
jgi:hypothetical protein